MATQIVLITGATGLVGSHLAALLVRRGASVHAIARRASSRLRTRQLGVDAAIRWHDADLTDAASLRAAVETAKPATVYHLAAHGVRAWDADADAVLRVNVLGGAALASACVSAGVRRLVWMGSGFEYDTGRDEPVDESLPLTPANWYAATKLAAWELARFHARASGGQLELVTARLFSTYGPMEHPRRLIPYVITRGLSGQPAELSAGTQRRDYLHADDAASALVTLGEAQGISGKVFNIGSGQGASVRDVAETISRLLPKPTELRFGAINQARPEPGAMIANTSAVRALGWSPAISLEEGLRRTIAWYRDHRDLWSALS